MPCCTIAHLDLTIAYGKDPEGVVLAKDVFYFNDIHNCVWSSLWQHVYESHL